MSCLTKGLCAPVGSLLAGPVDLIEEARVERVIADLGKAGGEDHRRAELASRTSFDRLTNAGGRQRDA